MSNKIQSQNELPHVFFLHEVYKDDLRFRVTPDKLKLLKKFKSALQVNKLAGKLNKESDTSNIDKIFTLQFSNIYLENINNSYDKITIADVIKKINTAFTNFTYS